jgi:hypothetical protein
VHPKSHACVLQKACIYITNLQCERRVVGLGCMGAGALVWIYTECSLCRLIRHPGSFSERLIGRHCGIPQQTEGHSFGDHLISESISVTPSSVIEAYFYYALFSVFMAHVRYNLEQRVFI